MILYVGNLPVHISKDEVKKLFEGYKVSGSPSLKNKKGSALTFVTIEDSSQAQKAINELNNKLVWKQRIVVNQYKRKEAPDPAAKKQNIPSKNINKNIGGEHFPYTFSARDCQKKNTDKLNILHHQLDNGKIDVAFEITWETLTPTAANPCTNETQDDTCPRNDNKKYTGYNNRWLMINKHLAISPFTVKSAIANGFANILGGCIRVPTKSEEHPKNVEQGHYYYNGKYKRYRVAMDNSKPAIIASMDDIKDGFRDIEIQPVIEYYYDRPAAPNGITLKSGMDYYTEVTTDNRKRFILNLSDTPVDRWEKLTYFGPYQFGMNLSLKAGQLNKRHHHRFYKKTGFPMKERVPAIYFMDKDEMAQKVYMGDFERRNDKVDPRGYLRHEYWYDDLMNYSRDKTRRPLCKGDWVYFQSCTDPKNSKKKLIHIGRNFQFKAVFLHQDAVPENQQACDDINLLCDRCAMFGMVDKNASAGGYKGRFRASTLISEQTYGKTDKLKAIIPYIEGKNIQEKTVDIMGWKSSDNEKEVIAKQYLMPLQGSPKPNKRDVGSYFNKTSGMVTGVKKYRHASKKVKTLQMLETFIEIVNREREKYAHQLRRYAQVAAEGIKFSGTVGAENSRVDEIAALIILLDHRVAQHGFKIGLNKSLGLGSIISSVNKIWIRKKNDYDKWISLSISEKDTKDELILKLKDHIPGIDQELQNFKKVDAAINQAIEVEMGLRSSKYPEPHHREYWKRFRDSNEKLSDGVKKSYAG